MKKLLTLLCFAFLIGTASAQSYKIDTILSSGPANNRINIVMLPDGYTIQQQQRAGNDGKALGAYLVNTWPFSQYKTYFNIYLLHVISADSGAKHPHTASDCPALTSQPKSNPNNYFGSTFDYAGIHRFLMAARDPDTVLMNNFAWYKGPAITRNILPIVIVNTPYYGGAAEGNVAVTSRNTSDFEIIAHELGHSLAGLGDEYSYTGCGGIEEWNCTQNINPLTCRWRLWFPNGVLNTDCTNVGAYLGANYCPTGWYRPECNCKMRALGQPYCRVCLERFVVAFNTFVNLIDAQLPSLQFINLTGNQTQTFSIKTVRPVNNSLRVTWTVTPVGSTVPIILSGADNLVVNNTLKAGVYNVQASVYDTTYMARVALKTFTTQQWTLTTTGAGTATPLPPVVTPPVPAPCGSPQGVTISGITTNSAILNWTKTSGVTYNVTSPDGAVAGIQPPYNIVSLDAGSSYSYTVVANCAGTLSAAVKGSFTCLQKTITPPPIVTPPPPVLPASPTGLTTGNTQSVTLQCNGVPGATSYSFKLNTGAIISSPIPSVTLSLPSKTNFTITVAVTTATGTSSPSSPITVTTP